MSPVWTKLKDSWAELTQVGVVIMSTIGGFLLPPPAGFTGPNDASWPKLAQFVVTVFTASLIVIGRKLNRKRHSVLWLSVSVSTLIVAMGGLFAYRYLTGIMTCPYYGEIRIVGSELTADAASFLKDQGQMSCETLLKNFTGEVEEVWTRASLVRAELLLGATYISVVPFLAICAIATLQAIRCSRVEGGRRKMGT
jgi:hypothetical protein